MKMQMRHLAAAVLIALSPMAAAQAGSSQNVPCTWVTLRRASWHAISRGRARGKPVAIQKGFPPYA